MIAVVVYLDALTTLTCIECKKVSSGSIIARDQAEAGTAVAFESDSSRITPSAFRNFRSFRNRTTRLEMAFAKNAMADPA